MPTVRFQQIDDQNRRDHFFIRDDDECYFLFEYTAGAGYAGDANQLIVNLKKKKGAGGYHWKANAIAKCAKYLEPAINHEWLRSAVLVPVPPSKAKGDPDYDDRILRICYSINVGFPVDVREIITQTVSTDPVHAGSRLRPEELTQIYAIDEDLCSNMPVQIGVVDDMLTAGAHFRAMKDLLQIRFPAANVVGFFITRRAVPNPFTDVTIDDLLDPG